LQELRDQIADTTNDLARIKSSNCWKKVSVSILHKENKKLDLQRVCCTLWVVV